MRKGFSAVLLIIVLFFLAVPAVFYFFSLREKSEIRGAVSSGPSNGFSIEINSSGGSWDLYEYGCVDIDECKDGLHSGRRISVTSGGEEDYHRVSFTAKPSSDELKYVKFFVKPAWGSAQITFTLNPGRAAGLEEVGFGEDSALIPALIMPVSSFSSAHFVAGSFSD